MHGKIVGQREIVSKIWMSAFHTSSCVRVLISYSLKSSRNDAGNTKNEDGIVLQEMKYTLSEDTNPYVMFRHAGCWGL